LKKFFLFPFFAFINYDVYPYTLLTIFLFYVILLLYYRFIGGVFLGNTQLSPFQCAKWILAPSDFSSPVIFRNFSVDNASHCVLNISSLGFFIVFVNGKRVSGDFFFPQTVYFMQEI